MTVEELIEKLKELPQNYEVLYDIDFYKKCEFVQTVDDEVFVKNYGCDYVLIY